MGLTPTGFDPTYRFFTSWLLSPVYLGLLRLLCSSYCFFTMLFSLGWFASHSVTWRLTDILLPDDTYSIGTRAIGESFSYFSYLSYWGLAFYLLFSGIHTLTYARRGTTVLHSWPRSLQVLHSCLYSTVTCFPILVTICFWGTLWAGWEDATIFYKWHNVSVHGLNSFFAFLEIVLTTTNPLPPLHIFVLCTILSVYLGLAYLTKATEGFYVYEWLNPAYGAVEIVAHVFAYAALIIGIFLFVYGIMALRCRILGEKQKLWQGEDREEEVPGDIEKGNSGTSTPSTF